MSNLEYFIHLSIFINNDTEFLSFKSAFWIIHFTGNDIFLYIYQHFFASFFPISRKNQNITSFYLSVLIHIKYITTHYITETSWPISLLTSYYLQIITTQLIKMKPSRTWKSSCLLILKIHLFDKDISGISLQFFFISLKLLMISSPFTLSR